MIPHPHQSAFIDCLSDAFRSTRRVLGQSACGSGKTLMTAIMARRAIERGRRPVVSIPRIELGRQTLNTFSALGLNAGPIGSGADCIVETMQTLIRRDPVGDFMINDEAHFGLSPRWGDYIRQYPWLHGLTASPVAGMDKSYDALIEGPGVGELIDAGFLSHYRAFAPSSPDLSGIPTTNTPHGRDYAPSMLAEFMSKPSITGSAVGTWLQYAKGKRTIAYCVSRTHSREVVAAFQSCGVPAWHIDGDHTPDQRKAIIAAFAEQGGVLSSVDLITLGFDLSSQVGREVPIEAMADYRPTKSFPLQTQKWGRALRRKSEPAIILDHAGNFETHGLPDDLVEWTIAGAKTRSGGVMAVSICHACFGAFRTAPVCPHCQTARKLTPREVEQRDGELREIERARQKKAARIEVGRADGLEALAKIAKARGYKPAWVVMRLKLKGVVIGYDVAIRAMNAIPN